MNHTVSDIKNHFTLLKNTPELAYLDSAATTQTPETVLTAMDEYYRTYRANIERGIYDLSARATEQYESARQTIARFINADPTEVVFTSGTTHSLNMLAASLTPRIKKTNNIVLTRYEHHTNLIPWQEASRRYGFELRFIELTKSGELDMASANTVIDESTAIVSFASVANSLGSTSPVKNIIAIAKKFDALTIVDAAQSIAHTPTDLRTLGCDFMVFSGHKMYGPTGIGVLYGKKECLHDLQPVFYGGGMIENVSYDRALWRGIPHRFEPGTPNIAGAIGLSAAAKFISSIGWENILKHEHDVIRYFFEKKPTFLSIHGPEYTPQRSGVISCSIPGIHPHDVAEILNDHQVAVRAGHHCAMPLMKQLKLPGTVRVSCGIYTRLADIDQFFAGLEHVQKIFKK